MLYSRGCSSPCKTCETDVTVCTSCDATSNKPYLSNKNCIASCPYSQYTASNNTCVSCQSPCASCSNSQTYCLSCISNPQMYLLNNECVSNCPTNYSVGDDGGTCEKTGEFFVPFIGLFLFLVIIAVVSLVKLCNKTTLYFESVLAITPYLVIMLNIVIIVLLFRDSHYQSGSICIVAFCALITINFFWTFCYYRKEIRNDALYKVWREYYPKTEILLYFCNYVINFQCYRLGLCQLAGLKRFKGSIRSINKVNVQLNRYMIFQILFVYLPILCACVYNLFWTTQYRQVFWNDIEMIIVTTIIIVFICIDIYTNDDSAVRKDFASKEEFTQNIDITDKSMTKQTIYSTKEDLQTNRSLVDGSLPVYNKGADLQKNVNKQSVHFEKKSLNQKLKPIYNN